MQNDFRELELSEISDVSGGDVDIEIDLVEAAKAAVHTIYNAGEAIGEWVSGFFS